MTLTVTEKQRIVRQGELDSEKSQAERNALGQFATPADLANEIAAFVADLNKNTTIRFLDPSIGTGSFFSATMKTIAGERLVAPCGVEIDNAFARAATALWKDNGLKVIAADFTKLDPPRKKFNHVLANPPYVRHHHLDAETKKRLQKLVFQRLGIKVSGLAGLYCYFLLMTDSWLSRDAISAWLIPSEFMDVNYGRAIKEYLTDHVTLKRIHRYCPTDVQFDDALVSSAVVIFEKSKPSNDHQIEFSFGGTLNKPSLIERRTCSNIKTLAKWTNIPDRNPSATKAQKKTTVRIGDLFAVKRGIATGSNAFFILDREKAKERRIPNRFLKPILPSPRHLKNQIIERDKSGYPVLTRQLGLLDCSLGEDDVSARYPHLWAYLNQGKEQGIPTGYLASRREPWYSQEKRDAAPFLCSYMGRSIERPFRFFWNKSDAIAANVFLLMYPKPALKEAILESPTLQQDLFDALSTIRPHDFFQEGRVYGGGLFKMEPRELKRLPADEIAERCKLAL